MKFNLGLQICYTYIVFVSQQAFRNFSVQRPIKPANLPVRMAYKGLSGFGKPVVHSKHCINTDLCLLHGEVRADTG